MEIKMVRLILSEEKYEISLPISIIGFLDLEHITTTHQYLKRRYNEFLYCGYLYMSFKKDGLSVIDLKRLLKRNDIVQVIVEFTDGTQNKYNLGDFINYNNDNPIINILQHIEIKNDFIHLHIGKEEFNPIRYTTVDYIKTYNI